MKKDLLLICPTRERPEQCKTLIKSVDKMSSKHVQLLFILDFDDCWFKEYQHIFSDTGHDLIIRYYDSLTYTHNLIVNEIYPDFDYYSITCDDFIYRTNRWDRILTDRLKKKGGGFAYGDDLFGNEDLPTTCVISANIIKTLGWIVMPKLKHLCADMVWRDIGHRINKLFYMPEVVIEHMTFLNGKGEEDETHKRTNSQENYKNDNRAFRNWKEQRSKEDIRRILCVINT